MLLGQCAGYFLAQSAREFYVAIFTPCDAKTQGAQLFALVVNELVQILDRMIDESFFLCHTLS